MIKAYYIMRKDLNMSPAKLAVQVGHGTQYLIQTREHKFIHPEYSKTYKRWQTEFDSRKIVCEIASLEKLENLQRLISLKFEIYEIIDSGYTEFDGKTKTGICFLYEDGVCETIDNKIKRLQLYK